MRRFPWFSLLMCALIVGAIRVSIVGAGDRLTAEEAKNPIRLTSTHTEAGLDPDFAIQNALESAHARVIQEFNNHFGERDWEITIEQLQKLKVLQVVDQKSNNTKNGVTREGTKQDYPTATVKVDLKPEHVSELLEEARQTRVEARQWLLGRVLLVLVVLFVTVGGYLRLEDATRGYYTTLLRVGAFSLVVGTATALWLML